MALNWYKWLCLRRFYCHMNTATRYRTLQFAMLSISSYDDRLRGRIPFNLYTQARTTLAPNGRYTNYSGVGPNRI